MTRANLHGVWAKWERAVEQLKTLNEEVLAFGKEPYAWGCLAQGDPERGHYVFRFQPRWPGKTTQRWGAIIGEIVHDYRSALDQLVCQLVGLNGGQADRDHSFPIMRREPDGGFAHATRRQWRDSRGHLRHGPLFGVSDDALTIIEGCQPYKRADAALLADLHAFWNTDKHQTLVPTTLWFQAAEHKLTNAVLISRDDRFEGDAYVVEITVMPGSPPPNPKVDMEPHTPTDITFRDGRPVIDELRKTGLFIHINLLDPLGDLFPDLDGVGLP